MKKVLLLFYVTAFVSINGVYSQQIAGDTLVEDFRYLVRLLEETHPDPYSGFGGKVFFHKEAFDIEQSLKKGASLDEFTQSILSFFSNLADGHTIVHTKQSAPAENYDFTLPLEVMVIQDGLMVAKIEKKYEKFLGSKLLSINGVLIADLCDKIGRQIPCENIYGKYSRLSSSLGQFAQLERLMPGIENDITIKVQTLDGNTHFIELPFLDKEKLAAVEMVEAPRLSIVRNELAYYDFLDRKKQAMYFKLSSVMAREAFVFMKENSWNGMNRMLQNVYAQYLKKEMPQDVEEAINALPMLADIFKQMLEGMKVAEAKYLIIDLRSNTGGFTPITLPTLYMLYGDSYLEKDMGIHSYRLISPLFLEKISSTLEEYNSKQRSSYQLGSYDFSSEAISNKNIEEKRKYFINSTIGGADNLIAYLDGEPIYTPMKVFVMTDERTFSAAFHYAFYLWKMGATIIGVPSMQAPNTYMEGTPFTLPLTGLHGSISSTFQVFLPPNDARAKVFYPDIMLEWQAYDRYGFSKDSDLQKLLDSLELDL